MEYDFVGRRIARQHDAVRREDASAHRGDADLADILFGDLPADLFPLMDLNRPQPDQDHRIDEEYKKCDDDDSEFCDK